MNSKIVRATLLQFSGIIGAGIFALPYFLYHSNFWWAVVGMFLIAVITAIVNVFYVEVIADTNGDHQLPGYAKKYLGNGFKYLATTSLIVSGVGAVLAYIKLGSGFLQLLWPMNSFGAVGGFLLLITTWYLIKRKKVKATLDYVPFITILIVFLLLQVVLSKPLPTIKPQNFNLAFFGVCVFALSGFTIIPEMEEILRTEKQMKTKLALASVMGLLLAWIVYVIFSYSIIKLVGDNLTEDSVSGLVNSYYPLVKIIAVFGLLTTLVGSINFMKVFHEIFYQDFKITETFSSLMAIFLSIGSLLLFNLTLGSILGGIGAGSIFVSAIIICLMRLKIKKNIGIWSLVILVMVVFVGGFISMI